MNRKPCLIGDKNERQKTAHVLREKESKMQTPGVIVLHETN